MQQRLFITFLLMSVIGSKLFAQKSIDILNYINTYKEIAINEMKRTGIPAAIKLAQGIHETEAGRSDLVRKSNNHFGIKCKTSWTGDKVYHDDDARGECFRSYARPEDSYMDHSDFLKNSSRYAFLFNLDPTDYEGWAYGLKKAGYATNIRYSQILIKIIKDYSLQDYTLIALGRMNDKDNLLVANTNENTEVITSPGVNVAEAEEEDSREKLYPTGAFMINNTKVVYAKANTAWLSLAEEYDIPLNRLWDFNDLEKDEDILKRGQLVYLQRKRKSGGSEFHVVKAGETVYDVCQSEGIRFESLLELNHLSDEMQPAEGEKLFLQHTAATRPLLLSEQKNLLTANTNNRLASQSVISVQPHNILHVVSAKETLYSIARKYGVDIDKIMEWNKLDTMQLRIGQELQIYKTEVNTN